MGLQATEQAYDLAKSLYFSIRDDFHTIENEEPDNEEYLMDNTLDNIVKMNRAINKINVEDFEDGYPSNAKNLISNVEGFKEAGYYIERSISAMKFFDKLNPVLPQYLKNVEWKKIGKDVLEASKKLGNYLTEDDNYKQYRTVIQNIIKGTLSKNAFKNLFDKIAERIPAPKIKRKPYRNPVPVEWYPKKDQKRMADEEKKRQKEAIPDEKAKFDNHELDVKEAFISLSDYKKIKNQ